MDNKEILRRFHQQKQLRTTVEAQWREIEQYIAPYRGEFFKKNANENSVEWSRFGHDYDSTGVVACRNLANNMHGSLTSPSIRWFEMRFRQEELNRDHAASKWLAECSERVYYELQDSNFNLEINETYQDLASFHSAALTLEEAPAGDGWGGLQFSSIPLKEVFFEVDHRGRVLRFYRELQWTPAQIISKFGESGVPGHVKELEEKGSTEKLTVIFAIYPRGNRIVPLGEKRSPSKRPVVYRYLLADSAETLGKDGGYYEMPAYVARWATSCGSQWGSGPSMYAMGDIKSLNTVVKQLLIASEKRIEPPILAEERSLLADLDLRAGTISTVRDADGIKAFDTGHDIYVTRELIASMQQAVRQYYFSNELSFPDPQGTPMTATEAQIRYELMQRLLGPTLGRIQNDLLNPIVSRAFRMLAREGQIPEPPPIVIEKDAQFDVEYLGPLARAQRTDRAAAIERFVGIGAGLAEVYPGVLDNINPDGAIRSIARDLAVPAEALTDEKQMKKDRAKRQENEQKMEQAMIAEQQGNAAQAQAAGAKELSSGAVPQG